jgi:hypothetical protein
MRNTDIYHGTYKVRRLKTGERIFHMPATISGEYALYEDATGMIKLVPMGARG